MSIAVIVSLFMVLFLQGAFVRYRLRDVETSMRATIPDSCPSVGNGVRTYALRLASCRMNELNARAHRPLIPRDVEFFSKCHSSTSSSASETVAASWLVMRRSAVSEQLQRDVESRRIKYLIISGKVVKVATVDVALQLGAYDAKGTMDYTYLLMVDPFEMATDPRCGVSDVILPWMMDSSYASDTQSSVGDILQMIAKYNKCGENAEASDIVVHAWAYGTSRL